MKGKSSLMRLSEVPEQRGRKRGAAARRWPVLGHTTAAFTTGVPIIRTACREADVMSSGPESGVPSGEDWAAVERLLDWLKAEQTAVREQQLQPLPKQTTERPVRDGG